VAASCSSPLAGSEPGTLAAHLEQAGISSTVVLHQKLALVDGEVLEIRLPERAE
jgi:hypothetical protein